MEKRILFITHDALAYGANQSLINILSSLKAKGIFVTVVFPIKGVICNLFEERGWDYHVIGFRSELCPKVNGFLDYFKNILRFLYKKYLNTRALNELGRLVDANQINIIHSNTSVVAIGLDLAKWKNIKHVWHLREYIHPNYGLHVFGGLEKYKIKIQNTDNILCITEGVAKEFNVENKAFVLHDAIRKEAKYQLPALKSNYFLFCGTLHKNKGIEEAISAFHRFFLVNSDYKLLIVGEGIADYKGYLLEQIKRMGMEEHVSFLGFRRDIDDLMAKATAFLMCSRNEALGRVTVEAMINFCIVLGYNDSGTSEIIEHKKTGFLYNNQEELVKYMMDVVRNDESFNVVRENAYQYAVDNFLEGRFGEKLVNYYSSLV